MKATLARTVLAEARKYPDRFDMNTWFGTPYDIGGDPDDRGYDYAEFTKDKPGPAVPPCGTVGCFAGFAAFHKAPKGSVIHEGMITLPGDGPDFVEDYAARVLGLTDQLASVLFHLNTLDEVEAGVEYLATHPRATDDQLWDAIEVARMAAADAAVAE